MKRPLMGLAVAYASGIWIGSLVSWPLVALIVSVAGLLAAFLFLHRTRFGLITLLTAVFATGILGYRQAATISPPNDITRLLERRDQNVDVQGVIVSDTGYRDDQLVNTGDVKQQRFDLELRALQCDGQWRPASGRILVFISEPREARPLRYGDLITFSAVLRVPPPVLNPGAFDARAWLARRDINFTATISQEDSIEVDAHDQGNPVIALSLGLRERLERALRLGLEDEPKLAGVLAGMVIGERSEIPQETYADFQHTGVFHVFAINGLHVGLVTAVVIIALRLVRIPRRWCGLVGIPLVALYVFATGAHPGAIRALVMASVWMLSWMLVRPADSLNTLAAAALVILLWDPTQLFDGGFLLSFIVVAAIVVLTPRIEKPLNRWVAPDPFLPRRFVSRWRRMGESTTRHGVRLLGCSLAAWVGLVPLLAVYFHLFTPVSIVANLLVIPLLTAIISLGLMATLAHAVWPWLTLTLNNANLLLLAIMTRSVGCLSEMPLGHWYVQAPPMGLVVAYYALGLALLSRWIRWRWRLTILVLAIPITGAAFFLNGSFTGKVDLTVLALNDGVSIFFDNPGERNDVLMDGGSDWSGSRVVVPFLRAQGVDRLAAMVLTRGDNAHAAGLNAVAQEVPTREAIYNGVASRSKSYPQWLEDMKTRGISLRAVKAGDELSFSQGVRVRVLNPPPIATSTRSEDTALVLAVEFGPTRVLLMSDAGETVEKRLLKEFGNLGAQVIVKGQHGSETSCTSAFLDAVRPEVVVQAVNVRPSNRYPEPGLRERLTRRGIAFYRTDEVGAITIRMTPNGYKIHTHLESPAISGAVSQHSDLSGSQGLAILRM